MRIVEIKKLSNGSHRNQKGEFINVPKGYAVIPDDMETPNFPFGEIEVEEIDGVMTVTKWFAGVMPKSESEKNQTITLQLTQEQYDKLMSMLA